MALKPGNGGAGGSERDPRLDLLYRDTAHDTPPAHLDAGILAAARREVGARPRALSALRRWRVPVSIAAVVVLSVSLVTLVREEGGETLSRDERLPGASPPAAPMAVTPEQPTGPAEAPEVRKRAFVPAPEELSRRRDQAADKTEAQPRAADREQARSSTAPAAKPGTGAAPQVGAVGDFSSNQLRESPVRAEADAAQRPASSGGVRGRAADPAPRAAAPQPKPLVDRKSMQAEQAPAMKRVPVWQGLEQEPPAKWLERLAELRRQDRTSEADELLAEIKRRFPDQPLPAGVE